ncbi:MAG: MCE family protein [Enhydrobacter sp.]|nr:MAG: MCE family protein [Enhydrobacter sp.]
MSPSEPIPVPIAGVRQRRRIPLVWLVPAVTLLIALWLAWDTYSKRGPTITVAFEQADGLQAGQSQLKFKDVTMGTVKSIAVAPDFSKVLVRIETTREAEPLLTDKTIFWVVKPQLFAGSVSGLDTLLSGSYVGMMPSTEPGKSQREFVGKADPPILKTSTPGTVFILESRKLRSIGLGAPVFYRGIDVGTVLGWDLGDDKARHVAIHAFVRAPFDSFVHVDTMFWNASGMSVKMGANGLDVRMESVKALLLGGIAFEIKPRTTAPAAKAGHRFALHSSEEAARTAGYSFHLHLRSEFAGSVAGLEIGSDVTLHGLKVGEVTDVGLKFDAVAGRIVAPVSYRIDADRIGGVSAAQGITPGTIAAEMVKRGFRATLQAQSLISGQKVVAIEKIADAPPAVLSQDGDVFVMPSSEGGGFDSITRSANELLSKINRIDFEAIGNSVASLAKGLDQTVNGPEIKSILADAADTMRKLDEGATPALARLPEISLQLQQALTQINRLAASLNTGYGAESKLNRDVENLLRQLTDTVRSVRALSDLLTRHPEALIKGRGKD